MWRIVYRVRRRHVSVNGIMRVYLFKSLSHFLRLKTKLAAIVLLGMAALQTSLAGATPVFINEVLASNVTYVDDAGNTPDWIELFNPSANDVNLGGMSLSNDSNRPKMWVFPEGTTVRAGRYLAIYFNGSLPASVHNTGFSLSASGDAVYFYDANNVLVDSVVFGIQIADCSIGRLQTISNPWQLMSPTIEGANQVQAMGNRMLLKINEWMADPSSGKKWFELYNADTRPVEMSGLYLSDSLKKNPYKFKIPALSYIGTGPYAFQKFISDDVASTSPDHVNFKISKSGDEIGIFTDAGIAIDAVTYGEQITDVSEGLLPDGHGTYVKFYTTSTPGTSNFLPITNVVINEILTHTDPPMQDSLELFNATSTDVAIGNWYISDSPINFKKFQIPAGTVINAFSFEVYYENQFTNAATPFNFNSSEGDSVILSAADSAGNLTGYRTEVHFGAAFNGVSFGRYVNSVGAVQYPAQIMETLGSTNAGPRLGPIAINEVMFNPPAVASTNNNTQDEYVELFNMTSEAAPLYNPMEPTNAWRIRGGITYDFPTNVMIPPGGYVLVVNFDPWTNGPVLAGFMQKYGVSTNIQLFGPYQGNLGNSGDSIKLEAPDAVQGIGHINEGYVPYVVMDLLEYSSSWPWPTGASATGMSLQKKDSFQYGNDPANWYVGLPTVGSLNTGGAVDLDGDGMPNDWELAYQFDPLNPEDAALDVDGDGVSNLNEYRSGTDPRNAASALRLSGITNQPDGLHIKFMAVTGRTYLVQYCDDIAAGNWSKLDEVGPFSTPQLVEIKDAMVLQSNGRYYRLTCQMLSK